ncbi:MAG: very short patch repair endonuclease [Nanoarchaeota archaeon]|nr:very short patch repair endonuclease [Nanoarchaeota archaeon]
MVDNLSKKQRSYCMSKIKNKYTNPELIFKKKYKNFIYHPKNIFGNPDFIDYKKKTVVFIDGCFWHKCPIHFKYPKSNRKYWIPKLKRNALRDKEIDIVYKNSGWKVRRIWEHKLKH